MSVCPHSRFIIFWISNVLSPKWKVSTKLTPPLSYVQVCLQSKNTHYKMWKCDKIGCDLCQRVRQSHWSDNALLRCLRTERCALKTRRQTHSTCHLPIFISTFIKWFNKYSRHMTMTCEAVMWRWRLNLTCDADMCRWCVTLTFDADILR